MDEDILMQRAAANDVEAFGALVRAYQQRLVRFAGRILADRERAEDVVQEAFVRLWRARAQYRPQGRFSLLLFRIVRNGCLDVVRHAQPLTSLQEAERLEAKGPGPASQVEANAMAQAVRQAVQELPEPQRSAFVLSEYEGLAYTEIAQILDCPVGTVASRKRLAVETLRRRLCHWIEGEETRG